MPFPYPRRQTSKSVFSTGIEWWPTKKPLCAIQPVDWSVSYWASQQIIVLSVSDVACEKGEKPAKQLAHTIVEIAREELGSGSQEDHSLGIALGPLRLWRERWPST